MAEVARTREPVVALRGAISAGQPLVAGAGLRVLASGGDVVDAALAASAVAAVVEPAWCGLGGDLFLLVHRAGGETLAFNGGGGAPLALDEQSVGAAAVPRFGPLSIGVPGLADAWRACAERFATRPLRELLAPAIEYARDGFAVYPRLARAISSLAAAQDRSPGLSALLDGNGTRVGQRFRNEDLARSLEAVAGDPRALYDGPLGRAIVRGLRERGAKVADADLSAHRASWAAPLSVRYRRHELRTQPLPSQGLALLEQLRILEGLPLESLEPGSPELVELEVACATAALTDLDAYGADPDATDVPVAWLLSDERASWWRERLPRIADAKSEPVPLGADTTSIVVADTRGNVVTLIQSLFNEWGSRELVPGTGVLLNDRLASLPVDGDRVNRLRPGRRPLHTLHTYLALSGGEPVLAGATPGGRGQTQTNAQILVGMLDHGMDPQAAVDRPRWLRGLPRRGRDDRTVYLERGLGPEVAVRLRGAGHPVEDAPADAGEAFGSCTVIARQPATGALLAAADARRGGAALGW